MVEKPVVWLSGAFILGVAGTMLEVTAWPWLVAASMIYLICKQGRDSSTLALFAFVCLLGVGYTQFWQDIELVNPQKWYDTSITGVAQVVDEPTYKQGTVTIPVKIFTTDPQELSGKKFLFKTKRLAQEISYGQWLSFTGTVSEVLPPLNPGEFDYAKYLGQKGISGQIYVDGEGGLKVVKTTWGSPLFYLAIKIKQYLAQQVANAVGPQWAGLVQGMLLGGRQGIDEGVIEDFNRLGLVHILSVSGFQVGLILIALKKLGEWLRLKERATLLSIITGIGGYCLITGMEASVVRAGIMAILAVVGQSLKRQKDWSSTLALAGLILIVWRPYALGEPGFQLSFVATWAILYLLPVLSKVLLKMGWPKWLRNLLALPLAVQIGTWPIIVYHFNTLSWLSLIGNTLLGWLVVPITWVGMAGLGCSWLVGFVGRGLLQMAALGIWGLVNGADLLARIPWGNYNVASPAWEWILVYFGCLVATVQLFVRRDWRIVVRGLIWRNEKMIIATICVVLIIQGGAMLTKDEPLEVVFLAVGQGDSMVIKTPDGKTILLDTGGKSPGGEHSDPGARVVVPYLKSQGIDRLDAIILSHPDGDHINGLPAVVKAFPDTQVWVSPYFSEQPLGQETLQQLKRSQIPVAKLQGAERLQLAQGVYCSVLQPAPGKKVTSDSDSNNNSLVLKLTYGSRSFLFTGDAEKEALQELVRGDQLTTDVLKIPHHGGKSSFNAEAYRQINFKYAIISVGKNMFGHPNPEVVQYLNTHANSVWQTNLQGAISLQTDGTKMWFSSYKGGNFSGL